jgi:hypothetical protein
MNSTASGGWGYRVGGLAAVIAGVLRLSIVTAFALTGLGAAGDRSYGSFSGLTFIPSAVLVVAVVGLYGVFSHRLSRAGQLGLVVAAVGLTLTTVGDLGGEWLAFPRSGNYLIGPGTILMMAGLIAYWMGARNTGIPSTYSTLAFLIALLPLVFFPLAAAIEVVLGGTFPPSLHENYFRVHYGLGSLLWLALGTILLRDSRGVPRPTSSA